MAGKKTSQNPAKGVKWDLSDLYSSINDPQIDKDKNKILELSENFTRKYKGNIKTKSLDSQQLMSAIKDYEKILTSLAKFLHYGFLLFATNTEDDKIKSLYQSSSEFETQVASELLWFELELQKIPSARYNSHLSNPTLKHKYGYYLDRVRAFKPFTKSEKEELILNKKSQTSREAFARFFEEKTSMMTFPLKLNGKTEQIPLSNISKYTSTHPDRSLRKRATESVTNVFKENSHFFTFVLNTLLLDKKVNDEVREYKFPEQSTLIAYDVDKKVVDTMVSQISLRTNIVSNFYNAKKKILKEKVLYEWDRYSPLFPDIKTAYSWHDTRNIIQKSFLKFSSEFSKNADTFFERNWIDAEIKKGKRGGGFCTYGTPSLHPYILVNFSGEIGDVTTVAHELGHGMHAIYSAKKNSFLNFDPSTATAEIASVFSESLVFDELLNSIDDNKVKLELLSNKIQGMFATIYRQTEFFLFEQDVHNHRKEKGELTTTDISNYYQSRLQHMFGNSVTLTEGHGLWWEYISHFYRSPFYVFTYAFGELLSLALYAKYKQEGKKFIDNYIEALKAGGSKSPVEITSMMGVDINDPKFWDNGLNLLEQYVDEFEQLAAAV